MGIKPVPSDARFMALSPRHNWITAPCPRWRGNSLASSACRVCTQNLWVKGTASMFSMVSWSSSFNRERTTSAGVPWEIYTNPNSSKFLPPVHLAGRFGSTGTGFLAGLRLAIANRPHGSTGNSNGGNATTKEVQPTEKTHHDTIIGDFTTQTVGL